jgi:hypothetical protein
MTGTLTQRFWSKVDKNGPELSAELGPCWLWTGWKTEDGYGHVAHEGKDIRATHAAILIGTGKLPELNALHKCDNPPCVRLSHLFQGTNKDNAQDAMRKGRNTHASGEINGHAKLTWHIVKAIRKGPTYKGAQKEMADKYKVSQATISMILSNQIWRQHA